MLQTFSSESSQGATHAIRMRLHFEDDRLWKRFSARRLELIDTLDLSSKKASEQDNEVQVVADILRNEFNYSPEYTPDFIKLVRVAVQSVRRNRKRTSRSWNETTKKPRPNTEIPPTKMKASPQGSSYFISEITKLTDDYDEVFDMTYSGTRLFSVIDKSKAVIDSLLEPRTIQRKNMISKILSSANSGSLDLGESLDKAISILLNTFERSKVCGSVSMRWQENLENLGENIRSSAIYYTLERHFQLLGTSSKEYLREKMIHPTFAVNTFHRMRKEESKISDEVSVTSFHTLLGASVMDFGFDAIMTSLGDIVKYTILKSYPHLAKGVNPVEGFNYHSPLKSLAGTTTLTASPINEPLKLQPKKKVRLHFGNSSLELFYPYNSSACPKFIEIIENARQAFDLVSANQSLVLGIRDKLEDKIIYTDRQLEVLFARPEGIELEIFNRSAAVPSIQVSRNAGPNFPLEKLSRLMLPQQSEETTSTPESFDRRAPDSSTVPIVLPKFQHLL